MIFAKLTITVSYNDDEYNDKTEAKEDVKESLDYLGWRAHDAGFLTGDSKLTVHTSEYKVEVEK